MSDVLYRSLSLALKRFVDGTPLRVAAKGLLNALGYQSNRTALAGSVDEFLARYCPESEITKKQRRLFEPWTAVEIVFQYTAVEVASQSSLFDNPSFDEGRIESFLFLAVDLEGGMYSRTHLAETTRVVNGRFAMPVILLFRHGSTITLSATHRRAHKTDENRDVLERVTLVKDIRTRAPHRAHLEILSDLSFHEMTKSGVTSFDELHTNWERTLDIELLNKRFYREIFGWFESAVRDCRFPDDGGGEGSSERHVIRLITRLLFIWFLKVKHLVPEELFEQQFAQSALKNYSPDTSDYYRAVLQNLFFATLNTEIEARSFSNEAGLKAGAFSEYRYGDLLRDPNSILEMFDTVPFVNGGLFDCLDDLDSEVADEGLIDVFTDNPISRDGLYVPARLFLDTDDGLFAILNRYKFTVEESTPLDREAALDPELLGHVFENLLGAYNPETRKTARKNTGSYYTPRPVVDFMVREALAEAMAAKCTPVDSDIDWWHDRLRYLLDHSDAMSDADELFEESDRKTIVEAIADIRVIDPAVGSGAFPMGILQTLTLALRRLDPDNKIWEEIQKERAKERASEAFDTQDQLSRDEMLNEISATFEKYRESDFGRKLYLIQNGIYGVDIQPIACQIAKLRFFISLVIEQRATPDAPNLGIRPLPNLETRLIAADSLLGFTAKTDDLLRHDAVASKQQEVAAIRESYFLADSRPRKLSYVTKEKRLRSELKELLDRERQNWIMSQKREIEHRAEKLPNLQMRATFRKDELQKLETRQREYDKALADARGIAEWDPYDQNAQARWFSAEYMFGVRDGFDVVIGNPPYIRLQKNGGRAANLYKDANFETFERTGDIYQLFFERGSEWLAPKTGTLAYITSNSWLKAEYGRSLRHYFATRHTPLTLVEMGKDVFENTIVDTAVLIVRRGKESSVTCQAVDVEQTLDGQFPPARRDYGTLKPEGDRPWMALSTGEQSLMQKVEAIGIPLRDWDISVYYGIKTGFNDAFMVDTTVRDRLIAEDPSSDEILKPVIRGRDIARYQANWAGLWLIDAHNGYGDVPPIDILNFPAIKAHLDSHMEHLRRRRDKGVTPYNLRNCAYHEEFQESKVFWTAMAPYARFALVKSGVVCNNACFMVTGTDLEYLCGVLNSKLVTWLVRRKAVTTGMGLLKWEKYFVQSIPIGVPDDSTMELLSGYVKSICVAIEEDEPERVEGIQAMIDSLVFDLYSLSAERNYS